MRVAAEERGPLEEELAGILSIPAIGAVVLQTQSMEFAGEPRQVRRPRAVVRSMAGRVERGRRQASEWIRDEQRLRLQLEVVEPDSRPPLLAQAILGIDIAAPGSLAHGIPQNVPPRSPVQRIRITDIMQQVSGNRQALAHTVSQRIPSIFEIHPDKPPLESSGV